MMAMNADVRRTAAAPASVSTLAGLLAAEDASADAALIELCAAWPAAEAAFEAEAEDGGPAVKAFEALADRITATKPRTLAGMLAKARLAKADAAMPNGEENPRNTYAGDVAWDLLNDLLRLAGEGV